MFENLPVDSPSVSTSVLVAVLAWLVYQVVTLYARFRGFVKVYDHLPKSKEIHWFWGHMHTVYTFVFAFYTMYRS